MWGKRIVAEQQEMLQFLSGSLLNQANMHLNLSLAPYLLFFQPLLPSPVRTMLNSNLESNVDQ